VEFFGPPDLGFQVVTFMLQDATDSVQPVDAIKVTSFETSERQFQVPHKR